MSPILSLLSLQSCCSLVERAHTSSYRSPFSRSSPHSSTPHTTENSSRAKKTFCEMARDPTDKAKFCFLTLPTPTPTCSSSQIQAELGRSHRPPFVCGWICVCVCVCTHAYVWAVGCACGAVHVGCACAVYTRAAVCAVGNQQWSSSSPACTALDRTGLVGPIQLPFVASPCLFKVSCCVCTGRRLRSNEALSGRTLLAGFRLK